MAERPGSGSPSGEPAESEREEGFLGALLAGDFAAARTLAGSGPGEVSPYRGAAAALTFPAFDRAIDLLEQSQPVGAYFVLADAADANEHILQSALMNAIGAACETAGERHVARAAYEAGANVLEARRLESDIPLTRVAMDERVHQAGVVHHRAALEADPDDVAAMEGLALRLEAAGEYVEASEIARRTIARYPSRAGSHVVLVEALAASGDAEAAFAAVESACEVCPDDPIVWMKRGELTFFRHHDVEAAHGHYLRALELDETLWEAHHHVELILNVTNQSEARIAQLVRMLPFAPTADERDRVTDELDRARAKLEGGEMVADAERRIEKRRTQRDQDIERGLRIPDRPKRNTDMTAGSALAIVAIVAVILAIMKWMG